MNLRFCSIALSALTLAAPFLPAQQPAAPRSIVIDAVVTAKNGPPVASLPQNAFTLLDNKAPRALTSFRAVAAAQEPVKVILLIDAVNTRFTNIAYERSEIAKFLQRDEGRLANPTTIAIFTDTGSQILPGFSTDGNALNDALKKQNIGLRNIRRSAGFYGASERLQLSLAALHQFVAVEAAQPGRKLVVWISPGWPYLSGPGINLDTKETNGIFADIVSLSTGLRQARITLYNVDSLGTGESLLRQNYYQSYTRGITKPGQADLADLSLQVLSVQSGGLALNATNDLVHSLAQCVEDTTAFYELSFDPPPAEKPNEYHHLELQVTRPGLTARTRDGYYLNP